MVVSAIGFTLLNTFLKYLDSLHAFQLVFFRSVGSLFFTFPFLLKNRISFGGNQRSLLILRGVVGVTSMWLFIMGIKYLSIGTAVSIRYIGPIFAAIFSVFILSEKVKPVQWLYFFMAFLGVVLLKGFDVGVSSVGLLLTLGSAITSGLVYTLLRKIGSGDHPVVVVNYFMIIAALVGLAGSLFVWKQPVGWEWVLLSSLGVFGYVGQLFMTKAFQFAQANQVAPLKYIEVIMTMLVGVLWYNDTYTLLSLLGILLIFLGLVLNVLVKKG